MDLQTIQKQVERTFKVHEKESRNHRHVFEGMFSEIGEALSCIKKVDGYGREFSKELKINFIEEMGDLLWFFFAFTKIKEVDIKIEISQIELPDSNTQTLYETLVSLLKSISVLEELEDKHTMKIVGKSILNKIAGMLSGFSITLEQCWEINQVKLKARYPNNFNIEDSKVRDLENEYQQMIKQIV